MWIKSANTFIYTNYKDFEDKERKCSKEKT